MSWHTACAARGHAIVGTGCSVAVPVACGVTLSKIRARASRLARAGSDGHGASIGGTYHLLSCVAMKKGIVLYTSGEGPVPGVPRVGGEKVTAVVQ